MARYACPSCGAAYNGRKCRQCLYTHFMEEIAHGNHIHTGEPLVIEATARRPIPRKDPFGCEKNTRKRPSRMSAGIAVVMVVLSLIGPILEGVFSFVEEAADSISFGTREPEIAFPEECTRLFAGEGLEVVTTWAEDQPISDTIPIYVQNETGEDLILSARDVILNDCMSSGTYLHCEVRDGRTATADLRISRTDMDRSGIGSLRQLQFCLDAMERDSYETLLYTDPIVLAPKSPDAGTDVPPEGTLLYDDGSVTISCLGYVSDDYYPGEVWEGTILFHLENHTDRRLEIWAPEITLNGEKSELNLWSELCPNTRTVAILYLHSLEGAAVTPEALIQGVEICFCFSDSEDYTYSFTTEALSLSGR
nr:hypothetical protein [Oscillospiraceae bacterium]